MTEHTKTPWIANDQHSGLDTRWRVESEYEHSVVNDGWVICNCYGPDAESNAKFIARACNHHDELVGICELLARNDHPTGCSYWKHSDTCDCGVDAAKSLLSKLEAEDAK